MNNSLKEIRRHINDSHFIVLGGHTNPDGDAIGACLGLGILLKESGKKVTVILEEYGLKYDSISGKEMVIYKEYDDIEPDLFISLDCGDKERLGKAAAVFDRAKKSINIDHHESNTYFGMFNYVEKTASSTSEIVFRILEGFLPLNKNAAAALYTGILYDTGGFRHTSTSPKTMETAAKLMEYGIPFTEIYHRFFDARSFSELKIIGRAFDNASLLYDNRFIYTTITVSEISKCNGTNKELDSIVNFIKNVNGVQIACFLYEKEERLIKASFRSADGFDVCALCQKFGGGGHIKAAGCTINATLEEAKQLILQQVKELFLNQGR